MFYSSSYIYTAIYLAVAIRIAYLHTTNRSSKKCSHRRESSFTRPLHDLRT